MQVIRYKDGVSPPSQRLAAVVRELGLDFLVAVSCPSRPASSPVLIGLCLSRIVSVGIATSGSFMLQAALTQPALLFLCVNMVMDKRHRLRQYLQHQTPLRQIVFLWHAAC